MATYTTTRMKKFHKNILFDLTSEQEKLLIEVKNSHMKLSKRQSFVLNQVLKVKTYHENHQYHLQCIRKNWIKFSKKPQLINILP